MEKYKQDQLRALIRVLNAGSPTNGQEDTENRILELLPHANDEILAELLRNPIIATTALRDALFRGAAARVLTKNNLSPHHPHCEHYTPPETDPRYAKFGVAMWKFITDMGGDFCMNEISDDILPLACAAGLCQRVKYDPTKHGIDIEADPGVEIWYWGEPDDSMRVASEPIPVILCSDEYYLSAAGFRKITSEEYDYVANTEEAWISGKTIEMHALVLKLDNSLEPWFAYVRHPQLGTLQRPTHHKGAYDAASIAIEQLKRWKSKIEGGKA